MLVVAVVLFVVSGLLIAGNWRLCAQGRSLVPLVGGACGLAASVLVDTPALGLVLLLADPGTLLLLVLPLVMMQEWRRP